MEVSIKGINKAVLLAALHNGTESLGMGYLQARGPITQAEAQEVIDNRNKKWGGTLYFDYLFGRPLKCDIGGDTLLTALYNRDAGDGAAERIVEELIHPNRGVLPMTSEEREAFYDKEIAPVLLDLGMKCHTNGLPFLAYVEWAPNEYGATELPGKDISASMRLLFAAGIAQGDLDALVFGVLKHAKKNNINTSASIVARLTKGYTT